MFAGVLTMTLVRSSAMTGDSRCTRSLALPYALSLYWYCSSYVCVFRFASFAPLTLTLVLLVPMAGDLSLCALALAMKPL